MSKGIYLRNFWRAQPWNHGFGTMLNTDDLVTHIRNNAALGYITAVEVEYVTAKDKQPGKYVLKWKAIPEKL